MNPGASLPTGDPDVDALVDLGAQAKQLPAGGHKALYTRVLEGLERELAADPAAAALSAAAGSAAAPPAAAPPAAAPPAAAPPAAAPPAAELQGTASERGQAHDQA